MADATHPSLKQQVPFELVYQAVALVVAIILVHLVYITVIRPNADAILTAQAERAAQGEEFVQERSLYQLGTWDERYVPLIEMADPGEEPTQGALLVAPLDRGLYVYTGLALFRQLPKGVPGAYRLFANLLSLRARGVS